MDELLNLVESTVNGVTIGAISKEDAVSKIKKHVQALAQTGVRTSRRILDSLRESDRIPSGERKDLENGKLGSENVEYYIKKHVSGMRNEELILLESGTTDEKIIIGVKNFKEDYVPLSTVLDRLCVEIAQTSYSGGAALTAAELAVLTYKWCNHTTAIPEAILATEVIMKVNNAEVFRAPLSHFITNEPFIANRLEDIRGGVDVADRLLTSTDRIQFVLDTPSGVANWGTSYRYALRVAMRGAGYTRRGAAAQSKS